MAASCNKVLSSKILPRFWIEFFESAISIMSVTSGSPFVRVPVLSKTIACSFSAVSSASPLLIKIPFSAPFPTPTIKAVGVARPKAHGQATTRTAMKMVRANTKPLSPKKNHSKDAAVAVSIIEGTK